MITSYEKEQNTTIKVKGTSYILNERTANKIGFKVVKTDFLQKMILMFNYFNILISSSFAKKKLSFPKLSNIKTFESEISELLLRKEFLIGLNTKLKKVLANS